MTLYEFDKSFYGTDIHTICGTDEAGRGPLAGDVFAAAVVLPRNIEFLGLRDSKKLSQQKREALFELIVAQAINYKICSSSVSEIEELNILNATQNAMRSAITLLVSEPSSSAPDLALVDGNLARDFPIRSVTIIGGDNKSACIAAASILAKVARDRYMLHLDSLYPQYGFSKHKGYGTVEHINAIKKYGLSPVHRKSFLKKIIS